MPSVNGVNGQARRAEVALQNANKKEAKAQEKLATGMRVTEAGDDPTAVSTSQRLTLQSRGSTVAARNTNDGISMVQTASLGLGSALGITQRIRELALQGMNDTNSDADRASLNAELQQLLGDLDRIRSSTRFNGKKVFDEAQYDFQIGYQRGDRLSANFKSFSVSDAEKVVAKDWSFTNPENPGPASNLRRYLDALNLDPKSQFPGVGSADSVVSDGMPSLRQSELDAIIAAADDGSGPTTSEIAVNNAGFEADDLGEGKYSDRTLTDWTVSTEGGKDTAGAYNPKNNSEYVDVTTVTGDNVAYLYTDGSSISQVLSEQYSAENSYEFSLDLGDPVNGEEGKPTGGADYTVNLYAGSTLVGQVSGNTQDIGALSKITLTSNVTDSSLDGQQLRLEVVKDSGEELLIDDVAGLTTTPGTPNTGNDATWTLEYAQGMGTTTKTYTAAGANWSMQDLVDAVNADTGSTGWRAQLGPLNTTDAFTYTADSSNLRRLTLEGTGSATINIASGTDLAGLIELVNAESATTGVTAVEEEGKIRFVSEADSVRVSYSKDPNNDAVAPLLGSSASSGDVNAEFDETYVKQASFYAIADSVGSLGVTASVGGTRNLETVPLGELNQGGGMVTDAPGLGVESLAQADYTLAVADEFIDQLAAQQAYYGSVESSFSSAESIATLTQDQASASWNNLMGIDEAQVQVEQIEAALLAQSSAAVLAQESSRRASVVSMLLSQRANNRGFF